ncbi:MAG: radical SAM protein [Krumholzibacteria bacterium]|nr:radical SAM protein [Candidatus Krumholzibacteria bacterium]
MAAADPCQAADRDHLAYGPVPSRRLGRSLGINNIPPKACTYSCLYCQVGRTAWLRRERQDFHAPQDVFRAVRRKLDAARAAGLDVDFLTFVPDGEPTLDRALGRTIALLRSLDVPIGVITNGSLLWRQDVRTDLAEAAWVSVKVDAVEPQAWRRVNRPEQSLTLNRVLAGQQEFAAGFAGELATETMLVAGVNDGDDQLRGVADHLRELRPAKAYLGIPTRPPAEAGVTGPDAAVLNRAFHLLAEGVDQVEYLIAYEGDTFAPTGDAAADLLGITAVHPMRRQAVESFLAQAGSAWSLVDGLVAKGDLAKARYGGHTYYLRRFAGRRGGTS